MPQSQINTDLFVGGNLSSLLFTPPAGSIPDAAIVGNAKVQASKLQHQYQKQYSQGNGTTAFSDQQVIHVVRGATGTIVDYRVGLTVAHAGAATVTVDLLKNGVSILTATITQSNTAVAYTTQQQPAGYTSTSLLVGDVLEIKTTATAGGGTLGKGVFIELIHREDAQ